MKKVFLSVLFVVGFSNGVLAQKMLNNSVRNNQKFTEALEFFNTFLNEENWATITRGVFTYNNYSNSLTYKSKTTVKNLNESIESEYTISLDNIKNIVETIYIKPGDPNVILFRLNLKNNVFYKTYIKNSIDVVPNYKNETVDNIGISITKNLTEDDIKILRTSIRDIFQNITIETKYL